MHHSNPSEVCCLSHSSQPGGEVGKHNERQRLTWLGGQHLPTWENANFYRRKWRLEMFICGFYVLSTLSVTCKHEPLCWIQKPVPVCQMISLSASEVQRQSDSVQMRLVLWSVMPVHKSDQTGTLTSQQKHRYQEIIKRLHNNPSRQVCHVHLSPKWDIDTLIMAVSPGF